MEKAKSEIYTIGYGNRNIDEFLELLDKYRIVYLVDIRTSPYSRFNPDFNKHALKNVLPHHGIKYVYMGDSLGGIPKDESVYSNDGKVDYEKLQKKDYFISGIARLEKAITQELSIAIMCSELKPENCHRSKLIGKILTERGVTVIHIDENGDLITQDEIWLRLDKGQYSFPGFEKTAQTSRKKYLEVRDDGDQYTE
jgi:uncharacterized protein (DUF488 family)